MLGFLQSYKRLLHFSFFFCFVDVFLFLFTREYIYFFLVDVYSFEDNKIRTSPKALDKKKSKLSYICCWKKKILQR